MDREIAAGHDDSFDLSWHVLLRSLDDIFGVPRVAFIVDVDGLTGGGGGAHDLDRSFADQGSGANCLSLRPGLIAVTGIAPKHHLVDVAIIRSGGEPIAGHHIQIPDAQVDAFLGFAGLDATAVQLRWNGKFFESALPDLSDFP